MKKKLVPKKNKKVIPGMYRSIYAFNHVLNNEKEKRKADESKEIEKDLTKLNVTGGQISMLDHV